MKLMRIGELVLNDTDFSAYKTEYQKIDGDGTKRNLAGTMRRQVVANKVKLVTKTKELMDPNKMSAILNKVTQDTLTIDEYWNSKTNSYQSMQCYCGTPASDIDEIQNDEITYKAMSIDFIEL